LESKNVEETIIEGSVFKKLEPPDHVHWVGRNAGLFFDFRTCDEIETAAFRAGIDFPASSSKYLDFGCSSGRTLRTFQTAFSSSDWFGCDPVEDSISWARSELTNIEFQVSSIAPPLEAFQDSQFDGIYAVSIWSHFREDMALAWFEEMYRILKKDGFLIFTTPGYHGLYTMAKRKVRGVKFLTEALEDLCAKGLFFQRFKFKEMDSETWGLTHIAPVWIIKNLINSKWLLSYVEFGGHKGVQDIYVLRKRS
jgi:SAM-dependent methyltransferase